VNGLFVTVAPNGARRGKSDHPRLPLTVDEIASCAVQCRDAGAAMVHLHVRDEDGRHSLDPAIYRDTLDLITGYVGDSLLLQVTTEAADRYSPREQMQCVRELKPDAASASVKELWPPGTDDGEYVDFVHECAEQGVWLQHIVYSPFDIGRLAGLQQAGKLPDGTLTALAVIGDYAGSKASTTGALDEVVAAAAKLENCIWSVCAFGANEATVLMHAAAAGWHIRVGFENNLRLENGDVAADNGEMVAQYVGRLRQSGYGILDAAGVRELFPVIRTNRAV
jgi:uncharacterized protein (DUF849 family)